MATNHLKTEAELTTETSRISHLSLTMDNAQYNTGTAYNAYNIHN